MISAAVFAPTFTCAPTATLQLPVSEKSLMPQLTPVEVMSAVLMAALAWFHFDGQVAVGVQLLPFAGSSAIEPDLS